MASSSVKPTTCGKMTHTISVLKSILNLTIGDIFIILSTIIFLIATVKLLKAVGI